MINVFKGFFVFFIRRFKSDFDIDLDDFLFVVLICWVVLGCFVVVNCLDLESRGVKIIW
jgi:hypothetical protein